MTSHQISELSADLGVPAGEVLALAGQLDELDPGTAVDPTRPAPRGDVIQCEDGMYANSYLTASAIGTIIDQLGGPTSALSEKYGV